MLYMFPVNCLHSVIRYKQPTITSYVSPITLIMPTIGISSMLNDTLEFIRHGGVWCRHMWWRFVIVVASSKGRRMVIVAIYTEARHVHKLGKLHMLQGLGHDILVRI